MEFKDKRLGGIKYLETSGNMVCPRYMPDMIRRNPNARFVPYELIIESDAASVIYEIDLMIPARTCLEENGADEQWMKTFMHSLDSLTAYCGEHLIDPGYIHMELDHIYLENPAEQAAFLFNPFEKNDFYESCRKLTAEILGNYFSDHAVSGEVFRERLLRETADKGFNPRNILAGWDDFTYMEKPEEPRIVRPRPHAQRKGKEFLKDLLPAARTTPGETVSISNPVEGMCLTGICSINTRIPVNTEGITVGRGMLQKEFGLYNSGIGRIHARIYEQEGSFFVTDLGSRNGTYINGERITKRSPVSIEKGDIVAFSDEEFILC